MSTVKCSLLLARCLLEQGKAEVFEEGKSLAEKVMEMIELLRGKDNDLVEEYRTWNETVLGNIERSEHD